ncbi:MAG: sensor histidine kinase [Mariprofundaceae bacterium]|nr:sensor histidine kinase [Mariprofundaceae bacterium]
MRSLKATLAVSLTLSLAVFFLIQALMVGFEVRRLHEQGLISRLEHDMEDILAALVVRDGRLALKQERLPAIYRRPFSGHYFQLFIPGETSLRSRSLWDERLPVEDAGLISELAGPADQRLLVLSRYFSVHSRKVLLSVAEDTSWQQASSLRFRQHLLLFSLLALLLLLAVQIWLIRRGLKPLTALRTELERLERGETKLLKLDAPAEIAPLVDEINRLLLLLRQRLTRSRHALGDLAHALKTPLSRILQILERIPAGEERHSMIGLVNSIRRRIERELSRARMAGRSPAGFWPDPSRDLRDLAATLEAVHRKAGLIHLDIQENLRISADREDMMEMIGNLLDNACKWAESRVRLRVYSDDSIRIDIEDDGPGMSEDEWRAALNRGMRTDEQTPGHGLGLAIVRDIVAACQGSLNIRRSQEMKGLHVMVTLPGLPRTDSASSPSAPVRPE